LPVERQLALWLAAPFPRDRPVMFEAVENDLGLAARLAPTIALWSPFSVSPRRRAASA
jgi:hypothetical protein